MVNLKNMNNIIEYIDTNYYKNNEIYNLKLTNKYINNLKELKKNIIYKNRNIITYKYDIYDIFKYIDTNFYEDIDIKTIQKTFKKDMINLYDIICNRSILLLDYLPSIHCREEIPDTIISEFQYLCFSGHINVFNEANDNWDLIPINEYYSWKYDSVIDILYDKYILENINQEFFVVECDLLIYPRFEARGYEPNLENTHYELNPFKTFYEQLNWNFINYYTSNNILQEYIIIIDCSISTKKIFDEDKYIKLEKKDNEPIFKTLKEKYDFIKKNPLKYIDTRKKDNIYINNYNRLRYLNP